MENEDTDETQMKISSEYRRNELRDSRLAQQINRCRALCDWVPKRLLVAIMCFLTMAVYYMIFSSFNILISHMVDTDIYKKRPNACGNLPPAGIFPDVGARYEWNIIVQLQMMCAFHVGQVFTTIPGGILAEKVGARYMVGGGLIFAGVSNLLIPTSANRGANSVNMLRLLQGFSCGQIYPAMQCTFARWAPPHEKSKFVWTLFGSLFGVLLSFIISNSMLVITKSWAAVFYTIGTMSIIWALLWIYVVRDFPEKHPTISTEELHYIRKCIGPTVMPEFTMIQVSKVLTSKRYWALFAAHFAYYHGQLTLLSLSPKYFSDVLGVPTDSYKRIIPTITENVTGLIFCIIGDTLRSKKILSVTMIRKSFAVISHFATGLLLIGNAYVNCQADMALLFQTLAAACLGASAVTNLTNVHDLAPNHAGTVDGMIIFVPILTSITVRIISGNIFENYQDDLLSQWNIIMSSTGYIYIVGGIIFSIWASGKIQIWNFPADFRFPGQGKDAPEETSPPLSPPLPSPLLSNQPSNTGSLVNTPLPAS